MSELARMDRFQKLGFWFCLTMAVGSSLFCTWQEHRHQAQMRQVEAQLRVIQQLGH
jgi:hypothetical protein